MQMPQMATIQDNVWHTYAVPKVVEMLLTRAQARA